MINFDELKQASELRREELLIEAAHERLAKQLNEQAPIAAARIKERLKRVMAKAEGNGRTLPGTAKQGLQGSRN